MMRHLSILCLSLLAFGFLIPPAPAQETSANFSTGSVKIGYDSTTCSGSIEGAIRYNSTAEMIEYCDGSNWTRAGIGAVGSCGNVNCGGSSNEKVAFVTSTTYNGNLGGVSGADAKCASAATAAGLTGTYKAWISVADDSYNPNSGFTQATIPYELVDGTQVADNYTDLTDDGSVAVGDGIDNLINLDEFGNAVKNDFTWTNTEADGTRMSTATSTDSCSDWTNGTSGNTARIGTTGAMNRDWTCIYNSVRLDCDETLRLYCFEQ